VPDLFAHHADLGADLRASTAVRCSPSDPKTRTSPSVAGEAEIVKMRPRHRESAGQLHLSRSGQERPPDLRDTSGVKP